MHSAILCLADTDQLAKDAANPLKSNVSVKG